jgi:hypothetical protein
MKVEKVTFSLALFLRALWTLALMKAAAFRLLLLGLPLLLLLPLLPPAPLFV